MTILLIIVFTILTICIITLIHKVNSLITLRTEDNWNRINEHAHLVSMLKAHFGIMYDLQDFDNYRDAHRDTDTIPVTEGELIHFKDMLKPLNPTCTPQQKEVIENSPHYRRLPLVVKEK